MSNFEPKQTPGTQPAHARFSRMSKDATYNEPSHVVAKDGRVLVDGPDGVDVALTAEAARETSDRLLDASLQATGQRRLSKLDHSPKF